MAHEEIPEGCPLPDWQEQEPERHDYIPQGASVIRVCISPAGFEGMINERDKLRAERDQLTRTIEIQRSELVRLNEELDRLQESPCPHGYSAAVCEELLRARAAIDAEQGEPPPAEKSEWPEVEVRQGVVDSNCFVIREPIHKHYLTRPQAQEMVAFIKRRKEWEKLREAAGCVRAAYRIDSGPMLEHPPGSQPLFFQMGRLEYALSDLEKTS
ncbi:MAG: hypothetical protein WC551_11485 [Patescibacteria group bacterium]